MVTRTYDPLGYTMGFWDVSDCWGSILWASLIRIGVFRARWSGEGWSFASHAYSFYLGAVAHRLAAWTSVINHKEGCSRHATSALVTDGLEPVLKPLLLLRGPGIHPPATAIRSSPVPWTAAACSHSWGCASAHAAVRRCLSFPRWPEQSTIYGAT